MGWESPPDATPVRLGGEPGMSSSLPTVIAINRIDLWLNAVMREASRSAARRRASSRQALTELFVSRP